MARPVEIQRLHNLAYQNHPPHKTNPDLNTPNENMPAAIQLTPADNAVLLVSSLCTYCNFYMLIAFVGNLPTDPSWQYKH